MNSALLVMTNVPNQEVAMSLATLLVEKKLVACVNIQSNVQSVFRWRGEIQTSTELTLMIKSTTQRYNALESVIKEHHPYDVPEIIAIPIAQGLPLYLQWIAQETQRDLHV